LATSHVSSDSDLFALGNQDLEPLAARMRPESLADVVGQEHLLGPDQPLRRAIESGSLHSFVLWGPPGVGKTTLARLVSSHNDALFIQISAVLAGIKEIRAAIDQARQAAVGGRRTVLFVDEVHRFNKSQQDAFLPHIEDGTIVFIGATTENPSFEVNSALLSRLRVYHLRAVSPATLQSLLLRTLERHYPGTTMTEAFANGLTALADGDVRQTLNLLELAIDLAGGDAVQLNESLLIDLVETNARRFDKGGDEFYQQISALHKSVRGSDPDAALYWYARMLDGGCDPLYIARRCIRMASEDIGLADPRALQLALDAVAVHERLGSPEGELAIAQAVVYLACAAKSNAVYTAFNAATQAVQHSGSASVPLHLRNASTGLLKEAGYGDGYRYAHDEPHGFAAGENYFPEEIKPIRFYEPTDRGLERNIKEKLEQLRELNRQAASEGDA
jgi:putative ATPase